MKLFQSVLVAAAALAQCTTAFKISSTAAAAPSEALGEHEPFAKTWTVTGDAPLTSLQLQTLGRVFVDYDASLAANDNATVAQIVFSGNNTALLDVFEVLNVDDNAEAVALHIKNDNFEGQGYLLTRVVVANKQMLHDLNVALSSDTIVGDNVLVAANTSAAVKVSLSGSADVYVGSESAKWSIGSLTASVSGSGTVQVLAKSLNASDLMLSVAGSGDLTVITDETTISQSLVSAIAGAGDIVVQTNNLEVYNLTTAIAGSGDVTYSKKGACQEQTIALAGSGDVAAGSIVCVNTDVNLIGSGDVLVQTTGNLTVSSLFGSDVRYYGAPPANITVSGLFNFRGRHKNTQKVVKEAKRNSYDEVDADSPPNRAPVYVLVKTSPSFFSDEPKIRYDLELDTYDAQTVEEFLASQGSIFQAVAMHEVPNVVAMETPTGASGSHGVALFGVVGVALIAVGVAAIKYKNRRDRQQYKPLI